MKIINPATEELIEEIGEDTPSSLEEKYQKVRKAQPLWQQVPLRQRVSTLKRFGELLITRMDHLAKVLTREVGKPLVQSQNELKGAVTRIDWLTAHAASYLADEIMHQDEGLEERIVYDPLGVVCNISAWNYPYLVGVNVFVPALLAGNGVVYKPSEFATLTGLEIAKTLYEAGVPEEAFQVAVGTGQVGSQLLQLPFDGYFFTGSYQTGKYIYETVAPRMVPCQCELGGKDPLYVAADVEDVAQVAAATADGAFYNNGQSCCSVERIYVHEKVYDTYVEAFVKEVNSWKLGNPAEPGIYFGPVTRPAQLQLLESQVADALSKGAVLLTGGKRKEGKGYYFEPTVLVGVTHEMEVMRSETFGPLIGIMKVRDDAQAVEMMQDTEYGLTASVYSADQGKAREILGRLQTGTGYWNCCDRVSARLPWSGRNHSGFGVTLSHAGIRAFTRPRGLHLKK
ncbi:MAG: aldehyde dehydrogenase family protein [Bacteroidota bacterium]|nr:aldehyde dehydrogenase family protein [Bacteroidota bacterium]